MAIRVTVIKGKEKHMRRTILPPAEIIQIEHDERERDHHRLGIFGWCLTFAIASVAIGVYFF